MKTNIGHILNALSLFLILLGISFGSPFLKTFGVFAFAGGVTNWLAIHMLFEKVPFLYGSGVIPNKFEEFKLSLKSMIMDNFFSLDKLESDGVDLSVSDFIQSLDSEAFFEKIKQSFLDSNLGKIAVSFGGESVLDDFKQSFSKTLSKFISSEMGSQKFSKAYIGSVEEIVNSRLSVLTPKMLKEIIHGVINKHLHWLVVWGNLFGGVIGVISFFFDFI